MAYLLWILFRRLLDEGFFPAMVNLSSVTPVLKSDCPLMFSIIGQYQFNLILPKYLNLLPWILFSHLLVISLWMNSMAFVQGALFPLITSYLTTIFLSHFSVVFRSMLFTLKKAFDSVYHETFVHVYRNLDLANHYCRGLNHILLWSISGIRFIEGLLYDTIDSTELLLRIRFKISQWHT